MSYQLDAVHIAIQKDGNLEMVAFANHEFEPTRFIIIQRACVYDDQDKRMGMDKVYIEIEDQSRSQYGGIKSVTIKDNSILISLDKDAETQLKTDGDIDVKIRSDDTKYSDVLSLLRRMAKADGFLFEVEKSV